jgi:hypothetical protein
VSRWAAPRCETRLGASHRRRNLPCQDASGWLETRDRQGHPIILLAVSDGHGAAQHPHSATGSRLACEIALAEAAQHLAQRNTTLDPAAAWRRWLSQELPARVVAGWRRAVADHWTTALGQRLDSFSPIPYGATLGLLVLTPRGWGHTGLGDWDLLELSPQHGARIISQEPWHGGDAEATQSLCLVGAESCFAARSGWRSLPETAGPFHLVLSSDGLRKSCGSDADFFTLAQFLSGLPSGQPGPPEPGARDPAAWLPEARRQGPPADQPEPTAMAAPPTELAESSLAEALDRISGQGSGDDISVAIAAWEPTSDDQPVPADPGAWGAGLARGAWIVQPPHAGRVGPLGLPDKAQAEDLRAMESAAQLAAAGGRPPARAGAGPGPARLASRPTVLWLGAALFGLGFGLLAVLNPAAQAPLPLPQLSLPQLPLPALPRPPSRRPPLPRASGPRPSRAPETLSPAQEQSLRQLVAELCGRTSKQRDGIGTARLESRLTELFSARKASFERLRRQPGNLAAAGLPGLANDPLGALIAWSYDPASATGFAQRRLRSLGACEALITVLAQRWRPIPTPSPPSAAARRGRP